MGFIHWNEVLRGAGAASRPERSKERQLYLQSNSFRSGLEIQAKRSAIAREIRRARAIMVKMGGLPRDAGKRDASAT